MKIKTRLGLVALPVIVGGVLIMSFMGSPSKADEGSCDNSGDSTSVIQSNFNKEAFTKVIKAQGHVYADKADKIISEANKAGVSAPLFGAIMASESGWGTSMAILEANNPSGQMQGSTIIHYPTLDAGIEATGATLHNLVIERKLDTVEKLGSVYCPVGASNDPTGLNANWVPSVKAIMKTLNGGTDVDTIATGSDGCSLNDITVTGDKMNYFDKAFELGKKQLGKPYVLGADISTDNPIAFDCGAFTLWVLQHSGVKVPFNRIAQDQYNKTERVQEAKAGDLIFFEHTYDTGRGEDITHVGMVISKTEFIAAQGNNVQIAKMSDSYWKAHFAGFGRIK